MNELSVEEKIRKDLEILIRQAISNVLSRLAVEFNKGLDDEEMKF